MIFFATVQVALRAMFANKMRSILTALGIIIGVGAVIALVSIGRGVNASITERIQSLARIFCSYGRARSNRVGLPAEPASVLP